MCPPVGRHAATRKWSMCPAKHMHVHKAIRLAPTVQVAAGTSPTSQPQPLGPPGDPRCPCLPPAHQKGSSAPLTVYLTTQCLSLCPLTTSGSVQCRCVPLGRAFSTSRVAMTRRQQPSTYALSVPASSRTNGTAFRHGRRRRTHSASAASDSASTAPHGRHHSRHERCKAISGSVALPKRART